MARERRVHVNLTCDINRISGRLQLAQSAAHRIAVALGGDVWSRLELTEPGVEGPQLWPGDFA